MAAKLRKIEGEVLISLCTKCKCCLAKKEHCFVCHTSTSIANMCGCGECDSKANAFVEMEVMRTQRRKAAQRDRARLSLA